MTDLERELAEHLKNVTNCLTEHLSQEAHEANVPVERLCPCWGDEAASAKSLLERITPLLEESHGSPDIRVVIKENADMLKELGFRND
jgi:hypothetical protein